MDTLTTTLIVILIVISAIGLIATLLSLMGLDPEPCYLGNSNVGLLGLLLLGIPPGIGVAGLMHILDVAGPVASLTTGAGTTVLGCAALYPLLRALLRRGRLDLTGQPVTIVDTPGQRRVGTAETITSKGSQIVTVLLGPQHRGPRLRPGQSGFLTHQIEPDSPTWYVTAFSGS